MLRALERFYTRLVSRNMRMLTNLVAGTYALSELVSFTQSLIMMLITVWNMYIDIYICVYVKGEVYVKGVRSFDLYIQTVDVQ